MMRDFKKSAKEKAKSDPAYRDGLLVEAAEAIDRGEHDVADILLSEYQDACTELE